VDLVLVYGDVNSTVAAALVAAKRGIQVAHVEAGLRSGDWTMPEEINRVVTDRLSDLLFTPSRDAEVNLRAEGVDPKRIHFVGNVMVDTLLHRLPQARALKMAAQLDLPDKGYGVVTLHRPGNVDEPEQLRPLLHALSEIGRTLPLVFPTHPRTQERLRAHGLGVESGVKLVEPLAYLEMLSLVATARGVITDSGGLQEETTVLGVPCITVRPNTERPVTITEGTNRLAPPNVTELPAVVSAHFAASMHGRIPELWDGGAGQRIAAAVETALH
jgi:UDP-N-acetylglucosamine 2-epimerase (non-hydrolysing)